MYLFLFILSFIVFFLIIKKYIYRLKFYQIVLILQGFLAGVFDASLINFIYKVFNVNIFSVYFVILGVLLEEVVKFFTIYYLIGYFKRYIRNLKFGLILGGAVGFGFGMYENFLYLKNGVNLDVLIFRIIFVSGLIHILLCMIYGYVILNVDRFIQRHRNVFKDLKIKYKGISDFLDLVSFIYKNSGKSIKTILLFFWKLINLDVILNYIFRNSNKATIWGHSPVEILIELLIFGIFIHLFYNLLLVFIGGEVNYLLILLFVTIYLWLSRLVYIFVGSRIRVLVVGIILILPFFLNIIGYNISLKVWYIDLLFVYMLLLYVLFVLRDK